eukprot:1151925-Pelagomonas_calceolata.AAC.2
MEMWLFLKKSSFKNAEVSEGHAGRPYMAAQQRVKEFMHENDLRNRPHALIWLSKVYGIPTGMYACIVWGTKYLRERIQKPVAEKTIMLFKAFSSYEKERKKNLHLPCIQERASQ